MNDPWAPAGKSQPGSSQIATRSNTIISIRGASIEERERCTMAAKQWPCRLTSLNCGDCGFEIPVSGFNNRDKQLTLSCLLLRGSFVRLMEAVTRPFFHH